MSASEWPRIVIVGAGFGGLFAARALSRAPVQITLIDRQNHHLFQPLLYQVATAGLDPSDIAWPIRSVLARQKNLQVLLDEVVDVDTASRSVLTASRTIDYDTLILATGVRHDYFGHDDWALHAPGLKDLDDAIAIRRRILLAFEHAESCTSLDQQQQLLTFVIVGAGPTGVELAGSIAELARRTLARDFSNIDPRQSSILLIEAGDRVLPGFPDDLSDYSKRALEHLGVEVRLGHPVTECDRTGVMVDGQRIRAATVLWAAGVAASPAGQWIDADTDRAGRVRVEPDLSLAGHPEIYVIGDTCTVSDSDGQPVPGIAPAAKQQGRYVARRIKSRLKGKPVDKPFEYRHAGSLATIGRKAAVIQFPRLHLKGFVAWWIWGLSHIYFLIGARNPVLVSIKWLWQYLSYRRGTRLITGRERSGSRLD